jgi:hypothetical protein
MDNNGTKWEHFGAFGTKKGRQFIFRSNNSKMHKWKLLDHFMPVLLQS